MASLGHNETHKYNFQRLLVKNFNWLGSSIRPSNFRCYADPQRGESCCFPYRHMKDSLLSLWRIVLIEVILNACMWNRESWISLQWRHNGRAGVSNHQCIYCLTVSTGADQRKHQSSASLAFVRGIRRGPVNSPHKWPVTRKRFPFDDVIMLQKCHCMIHVVTDIIHTQFISACAIGGQNPPITSLDCIANFLFK